MGRPYWIGAYDELEEGVYIWEHNGIPLSTTPTSWGPVEPSGGTGENCVFVNVYFNWNDIECTIKQKIICEYEA